MTTKLSFNNSVVAGAKAAGVSALFNATLFYGFRAAGWIIDDIFVQPNTPLSVVAVIMTSILPTLIASMVFFLFEKFTDNGYRNFSIVSMILLVIFFAPPFFAIPNTTIQFSLALASMHLIVPFALLYFIKQAKLSVA